jgi:hypothetical protein
MGISSGVEPLPLGKIKRLTVTYDGAVAYSSASLATVSIYNRDSGANVWGGTVAAIGDAFAKLGFDVVFNYSPPRGT